MSIPEVFPDRAWANLPSRIRSRRVSIVGVSLALGVAAIQGCSGCSNSPERETAPVEASQAARTPPTSETSLTAIRAATSVRALGPFVADPDLKVGRAVIQRLGELGGAEAVKTLTEIFEREPRYEGTGGNAGLRADVVATLGRLGTPEARGALLGITRGWLRDGPKVSGDYAHIYDTQYFAVGVAALQALGGYDDEETRGLLRSVADDLSLFYTLREAAFRTSLRQEMTRKGLTAPGDRAAFLATKIDPEGVPVETRWTGAKPGQKTNAAAREAVIEDMVREVGWPAAEPLQALLRNDPAREPRRTLGATRMLADLVLLDLRKSEARQPDSRHRDAILTATAALSALSKSALTPETGSRVFGQLVAAGEGLNDEGVWQALRDLAPKITIPDAWTGAPPTARDIGVALPPDLVFVREYSRRISDPEGVVVEAWFLAPTGGAELVGRLEKTTGKTATGSERGAGSAQERVWVIELQPAPPELAGTLAFGLTVQERPGGYRQRMLGRTIREGRTLVCARRILPPAK